MKELKVKGSEITIFDDKIRKDDPVIWIHTFPGEAENIRAQMKEQCILIGITGADWNQDFSPWRADRVFASGGDFAGDAREISGHLGKEKSTSHRAARTVKQNNRQQRGIFQPREIPFSRPETRRYHHDTQERADHCCGVVFNHSGTETFRDKLLKMILADRTE